MAVKKKIQGVVPETKSPSISLANGRILLSGVGKPCYYVLSKREGRQIVTAYWGKNCKVPGYKWEFTGFDWGIGGEGARNLALLISESGYKVDYQKIMQLNPPTLPYYFEI